MSFLAQVDLVAFYGGVTPLVYREEQLMSSAWNWAKHLTLSHVTTLSLNWRDMDLTDGPPNGKGFGWMVAVKELRSMAPCPSGGQWWTVHLRSWYWDQCCLCQWLGHWGWVHPQHACRWHQAVWCGRHAGGKGCHPEGPWQAWEVGLCNLMKFN